MIKLTLKQRIINIIDNAPRGYSEELAKISGYSSGSNLKKVLKNEEKEFDKFNGLLELVKFLFNDDEHKMMEQYSKEIDPNNKTARSMLEYLSCNRLLDSMKELLDKMSECKNKESKEWAKVYLIQWNWQMNYHTLNVDDFLKSVSEVKTSVTEMKTFIKLQQCYGYYLKKRHVVAYDISQDIEQDIEEIKDDYIRNVYKTKINEVISYIQLRVRNNPVEARKHAQMVLDANIGNTFNAYAHYTVGCSYFYESYDKAKSNFNSSIEIYSSINREEAAKDVKEVSELLDIMWDKEIHNVYHNDVYQMYWILRNGLNYPVNPSKENTDEPYYNLLMGMKENDTEVLMQSMIQFLKRGDSFYANLPKTELMKRGYSQVIINELINIYGA